MKIVKALILSLGFWVSLFMTIIVWLSDKDFSQTINFINAFVGSLVFLFLCVIVVVNLEDLLK